MARSQSKTPVQPPNNLVQLHTTGTIQPPPLAPAPTINSSHLMPALGLIAISVICASVGTWSLIDSWYGGPAHRQLQDRVAEVNSAAIAINDRLTEAKGAICK